MYKGHIFFLLIVFRLDLFVGAKFLFVKLL